MNHAERFRALMGFQEVDRLPKWEWAMWWDKTIDRWRSEGLPAGVTSVFDIHRYFGLDPYVQFWFSTTDPTIEATQHHIEGIVHGMDDYLKLMPHLFPDHSASMEQMAPWFNRQAEGEAVVWITLEGFFWFPRTLMGFTDLMFAFIDQPALVHRMNQDLLGFNLRLLELVAKIGRPVFMTVAEDMSYNNGPMVSRSVCEEFLSPYYRPLVARAKELGMLVITDTDGDVTLLVPWLESVGVDGVLPLERQAGVDGLELRRRFPTLRMIGHYDKMVMPQGEEAMRREFERLAPLMRSGGFIPSVDHQTPPGVSLDQYRIYLRLLDEYTGTRVPPGAPPKLPEPANRETVRRKNDAHGRRSVTVLNPYRNVVWDRSGRYKSNLHAHSRLHKRKQNGRLIPHGDPGYEESDGAVYGSDGEHLPQAVIDRYREYGFNILAIADHDPFYGYGEYQESYGNNTTYPWTLWNRDPQALGMVAVRAKELTNPHGGYYEHDVSLFCSLGKTDQHRGGYDRAERLQEVSRRMGLLCLAHPRGNLTAAELAQQVKRHSAGVLMEVFTRGGNTDARGFWDEVLKRTMPFDPIWGVSVDDMHSFDQLGTNYSTHLLDRFDAGAVRHSLERGELYFSLDPRGNDKERHNPVRAPVITGIDVAGRRIKLRGENINGITWVSEGERIAAGDTLDLGRVDAGCYVRAELTGDDGEISCTQPFGVVHC